MLTIRADFFASLCIWPYRHPYTKGAFSMRTILRNEHDGGPDVYGSFDCSRCGEEVYISRGDFKERESDGDYILASNRRSAYVLCGTCMHWLAESAVNGEVPDKSTWKAYPIETKAELRARVQEEEERGPFNGAESPLASMVGLIPYVALLGCALLVAKREGDKERERDNDKGHDNDKGNP